MEDRVYGYEHDDMYAKWVSKGIEIMRRDAGLDMSVEDDGNGCSKTVSTNGMYVSTATSDRELYGIMTAVRSMMHIARMKEIQQRFDRG